MAGKIIDVRGDVFKMIKGSPGTYHAVMHGCNCFCNFGAGFALGIKDNYPEAFDADKSTTSGDISKMGCISYAKSRNDGIIVVNAYTQFKYGKGGPHFEYGSLRSCIARTVSLLESLEIDKGKYDKYHIIMPQIGCGYAGGKWPAVRQIVSECADFYNINITTVIYEKEASK